MRFLAAGLLFACQIFAQASNPKIVLQDVRLIDGTGAPPRDHVQIVIDREKISEIRSSLLRIAFPPGATILNLSGKTVIPGLINGHGHLGLVEGLKVGPENYTRDNVARQLEQYEKYGITTVISLGMNQDVLYEWKAEQERHQLGGATILTADRGIGAVAGVPAVKVAPDQLYRAGSASEARADVDQMAERHPDLVKIWVDDSLGTLPKMPPEVYGAAIEEAHKRYLRIASHVYYQSDAEQLLKDGVDVLAHSIRDSPLTPETIDLLKTGKTYYIPTLGLEEAFYVYADHPQWMDSQFFKNAVGPQLSDQLNSDAYRSRVKADKATSVHQQALVTAMANLKALSDAGATIAFGTDSGANPYRIPGWAEHHELELMVAAGMTPVRAIQSATSVNARMLHLDQFTGTVEKGKLADLLVLDADPVADITNTRRIAVVFHRGKRVAR